MDFDEEPEAHFMAFSADNEFVDGQWIDGEFYASGMRRGRTQTKEEAIYGVFGATDDYAYRSRPTSGGLDLTAPMNFVKKSVLQPEQPAQRPGLGSAGSGASSTTAGLGRSGRAGLGSGSTTASAPEAIPKIPKDMGFSSFGRRMQARHSGQGRGQKRRHNETAPAAPDGKFAKFEQHTKGFGLKMLQKMGFKGRLGKNEDGIAVPVQAQLRPKNVGLAFGGVDKKQDVYRNAKEEEAKQSEAEEEKRRRAEENKRAATWHKAQPKRPKRVYKTAEELAAEEDKGLVATNAAAAAAGGPTMIIDMRGPEVKVTSADRISSKDSWSSPTEEGYARTALPELQHNVRLLVDLTEGDIRKINTDRRAQQDTLVSLRHRRSKLEARHHQQKEQIERLEDAMKQVAECQEQLQNLRIGQSKGITKGKDVAKEQLDVVAATFNNLSSRYPQEFRQYELASLAVSLAFPLLKQYLMTWKPLYPMSSAAGRGTLEVLSVLNKWKMLLSGEEDSSSKSVLSHGDKKDMYQTLLEQAVLPRLQLAVSSDWQVREHQSLQQLLKSIEDVLPPVVHRLMLSQLVVPRLRREVRLWNPRTDPVPVHQWVLPWADVIHRDDLQPIYRDILTKLASILQEWHPSDASAKVVITPWKTVLQQTDYDAFMVRCILPKLVQVLRTEFTVNPQQQYLDPFRWVVDWHDLMDLRLLVNIIKREFFPKWFQALYSWLSSPDPNFDEVSGWYTGWKATFPPVLRDHDSIKDQFRKGLGLINQALSGRPLEGLMQQIMAQLTAAAKPQPTLSVGVRDAPSNRAVELKSAADRRRREREREEMDQSFREVVEEFAEVHNLAFVPNFSRGRQEGHQIYSFGRVNVYLDNRNIYAFDKAEEDGNEKGSWNPIALDALLERAQEMEEAAAKRRK